MKTAIFNFHHGIGDFVIISGFIRKELCNRYDRIVIPTFENYCSSLHVMFKDVPNIEVITDPSLSMGSIQYEDYFLNSELYKKYNDFEVFSVGFGHKSIGLDYYTWDYGMYKQVDEPFETSWDYFSCWKDYQEENRIIEKFVKDEENLIFVHDDTSRGFSIDAAKFKVGNFVEPVLGYCFTSWIGLIQKCTEIHCIPSSFSVLIDRIDLPLNPKLYLHVYARQDCVLPFYRKNWKYL